jgi:hypothetical protein
MDRGGHHQECHEDHRLHEQPAPLARHEVHGFLPEQPIPETLDWDLLAGDRASITNTTRLSQRRVALVVHFGNGALGDWGAHIFDTAHASSISACPPRWTPKLEGHSPFIFPQATTLAFKFPRAARCRRWNSPGMTARKTCRRCPPTSAAP